MKPTYSTIQVADKEVIDFTPQSDTQLAIVPLSVLKKLSNVLNVSSLEVIKDELIEKITEAKKGGGYTIDTIDKYVALLQDEIDFHNTVNLITLYEPEIVQEIKCSHY